jgi:hypothetical protein
MPLGREYELLVDVTRWSRWGRGRTADRLGEPGEASANRGVLARGRFTRSSSLAHQWGRPVLGGYPCPLVAVGVVGWPVVGSYHRGDGADV